MSARKILVTGASGFIGSALLPALQAEGFFVRGLSRRGGASQSFESVRLKHEGEIADWRGVADGVDTIIHLAGLAHFRWGMGGRSLFR